jgi:hypothetical protein
LQFGSRGVDPMSLESRVSHEENDYELAEVDPGVRIRLYASAYHMAASRPSRPGVRMLHRLRTRVTVFGATNENRHQTGTTTRPLANCWDDHRSVRRSANLSYSRTRSGVVMDASSSIGTYFFSYTPQASHSTSSPRLNTFDSDNSSMAPVIEIQACHAPRFWNQLCFCCA